MWTATVGGDTTAVAWSALCEYEALEVRVVSRPWPPPAGTAPTIASPVGIATTGYPGNGVGRRPRGPSFGPKSGFSNFENLPVWRGWKCPRVRRLNLGLSLTNKALFVGDFFDQDAISKSKGHSVFHLFGLPGSSTVILVFRWALHH